MSLAAYILSSVCDSTAALLVAAALSVELGVVLGVALGVALGVEELAVCCSSSSSDAAERVTSWGESQWLINQRSDHSLKSNKD